MKFSRNNDKMSADPATAEGPVERGSHFSRVKSKFRMLFRKYGWKIGLLICIGYLIRDGLLYIVIPYLVAKEVVAF